MIFFLNLSTSIFLFIHASSSITFDAVPLSNRAKHTTTKNYHICLVVAVIKGT